MNKRHQLRLALTRFKAFQDSEQRSDEILNQEFIDIAMAEARKKKSRQKLKDISDAAKILGKGPFEALRAPYAARAKEKVDEYIRERKARREAILKLCDGLLPQSGDKKIKVETRTTYEFSTQGGAAVFYARNAANILAERIRGLGIEVSIEETFYKDRVSGFAVFAFLREELDAELIRNKPFDLREWLKACRRRGVEPRVFNPFLPHGLEEKLGIDNWENDKEKYHENSFNG